MSRPRAQRKFPVRSHFHIEERSNGTPLFRHRRRRARGQRLAAQKRAVQKMSLSLPAKRGGMSPRVSAATGGVMLARRLFVSPTRPPSLRQGGHPPPAGEG